MTAVEKIIEEINNELQTLEGFDGKEITGSRIALEFVKKVAIKAKEMEKEQMLNAFQESRLTHPMIGFKHETFVDYYNETFK